MEVQIGSEDYAKLAMLGMAQVRAEDHAVIAHVNEHGSRPARSEFRRRIEVDRLMVVNGTRFQLLGDTGYAMVLMGPDGVVYKAHRDTGVNAYHREKELWRRFAQSGVPWCPDFWPYDEHFVMAMRRYGKADPATMTADQGRQHLQILLDIGYVAWVNPDSHSFGIGEEDGKVVLLAGGCVFQG